MRILIVGAGPTGLTAAVELARRGMLPDIIDRRDSGSGLSRAVGIMPTSLKILKPSGVTAQLVAEGIKFHAVKIYNGASLAFSMRLALKGRKDEFVLGLPQDRTEAHLQSAFEKYGGKIQFATELENLSQTGEQVIVTFTDGTTENYDYVIGADGISSTTRSLLGLGFPGHDLPETWSIADVDAENWPNGNSFTICKLKAREIVVVAPLEANRYRIISNTEDALKSLPLPINVTKIRRQGQFGISIRQVEAYSKGRVYLAGDAAHCHSPVGGRGMNLGISDSAELAHRFATGDLAGYSANRHREGKIIIGGSETIRKFVTSPNFFMRKLLFALLWLVGKLPFLQVKIIERILYGGLLEE
ncbi:MAG: FAD-dependent monooxygenase [Rhizobiales bacterium]|nr:FAD-dependent monooxygenase [Hyphomicrobiales bacterium]